MSSWIATTDRCQAMDRRATEEFGIPVKLLMEKAGVAVYQSLAEMLPPGGSIAVVCGRGHNGGDGFVVARLAHEKGYAVLCLVTALEADLAPETEFQMKLARSSGVVPIFPDDARWVRKLDCIGHKDLIIDAILGTGLSRPVHGYVKQAIQAINRSGVPALAVDVPSGICADTGMEMGESIWALRTVTFGLPKRYLFEGIGLEHAGYWTVADIGFPPSMLEEPTDALLVDKELVGNLLPERMRASHKRDNGTLLIIAGSDNMPGAAILCAKAAMRAGCGLVTVASTPAVCKAVVSAVPEVITLPLPSVNGVIAPDAAEIVFKKQSQFQASVFGPGLNSEPEVREFLRLAWSGWNIPCVIDADALNAVSAGVKLPLCDFVLTPHAGEMSRLLQHSVGEIQSDRFRTVSSAARQFGGAVLLKGPYTLIAEGEEPVLVNTTGNSGMASAGMGDVLSGIIGALLAQHLPPRLAAACGSYWHGAAGDLAVDTIGACGYFASEVADLLPRAKTQIVSCCSGCCHSSLS